MCCPSWSFVAAILAAPDPPITTPRACAQHGHQPDCTLACPWRPPPSRRDVVRLAQDWEAQDPPCGVSTDGPMLSAGQYHITRRMDSLVQVWQAGGLAYAPPAPPPAVQHLTCCTPLAACFAVPLACLVRGADHAARYPCPPPARPSLYPVPCSTPSPEHAMPRLPGPHPQTLKPWSRSCSRGCWWTPAPAAVRSHGRCAAPSAPSRSWRARCLPRRRQSSWRCGRAGDGLG